MPIKVQTNLKPKSIRNLHSAEISKWIKFIDKQVVKRNQDGDWKSEKVTKKLFKGFKKIKSDEQYNTYKKGGVAKTKKK